MPGKRLSDFTITQQFLNSVGGEHAPALMKICEKKRTPITDEEIEKKLKLKITEIRTILNRLHYRGIAEYQKSRNPKTGWYSYSWEVKPKRVASLILEQQGDEIKRIEAKIEYERNYAFFSCTKSCSNVPFEIAAEYEFKCPECGNTMGAVNNAARMRKLKKSLDLIKGEVGAIGKMV
ncbi:MAG: hypothetical protein ABH854_01655 [Candidatus Diapherotrites archaeon]|nr:hypothetical protein [Candidatus Micrarchaeota archaeon]MBU1939206.1 hypothetical protein [Candidatus Micrarchaeota archaeon]